MKTKGIVKILDFGFWFLFSNILTLVKIKFNKRNQNLLSVIDAESFSAPSAALKFFPSLLLTCKLERSFPICQDYKRSRRLRVSV